jgi:FkbM family methyltransferase
MPRFQHHPGSTTPTSMSSSKRHSSAAVRQILYAGTFLVFLCTLGVLSNRGGGSSEEMQQQFQLFFLPDISSPQRPLSLSEDRSSSTTRRMQQQTTKHHLSPPAVLASKDPGRYQPISCTNILDQVRNKRNGTNIHIQDPNEGYLYGRQTETEPSFWISLHNRDFDKTRWDMYESGHYYEKALTRAFQQVLKEEQHKASSNSSPDSSKNILRVLDVGGNIGYFTLWSAVNGPGVIVDTFEPNPKNRLRLCESLHLNQWHSEYDDTMNHGDPSQVSMVNLYEYGVGKEEGMFHFIEHPNPGQGKFGKRQQPKAQRRGDSVGVGDGGGPATATKKQRRVQQQEEEGEGLQMITLDNFAQERGWFQSRPNIAIFKVDVEGFEHKVIAGTQKLLQAKIIQNVFMEVSARTTREETVAVPALKLLQEAGYKLKKIGGFRGPNKDVPFPQDDDIENVANNIIQRTLEEPPKQLNLWWTL